jgi:PAS domain S-box-containing protein
MESIQKIIEQIVERPTEDSAYRAVVDTLCLRFKADGGILLYLDGYHLPRLTTSAEAGSRAADRETYRAIEAAAVRGQGPVEVLGFRWRFLAARRLVSTKGDSVGFILLGRGDAGFSQEEEAFLDYVVSVTTPVIAEREAIAREMRIRSEVEKSLRHSEESLRTFFSESRDMIYSSNADDCIASINAAGLALLGCKDRFEAVGRSFSDFVADKRDRERFLARIRNDGFVDDCDIVIRRPDGSEAFCVENASALRDTSGRLTEVQGIVRDVTERVRSERELWRTNIELVEANIAIKKTQALVIQQEKLASIGYLAAGIAHEINNPLGFLRSNHEFLANFFRTLRSAWLEATAHPGEMAGIARAKDLDYLFTETEALLAESDSGYGRIMEIVKGLKDYARAGEGMRIAPYDLNKGLDSSLVVAWNKVKYVAEVEKDYGELPFIEADGGNINQVLLNLIVNAAEAIDGQKRAAKGHIVLRTRTEGDRVVCTIEDDGPGVPEKLRLQVFDPFFTTKEPGKGTGLGLSISYDIVVNRHGGSLVLGASPRGGAVFTMRLPLKHPRTAAGEAGRGTDGEGDESSRPKEGPGD